MTFATTRDIIANDDRRLRRSVGLTCCTVTSLPNRPKKVVGHMHSFGARQADLPAWRKSSFCASGECVEVAEQNGMIVLRDSKEPDGGMLSCTSGEWQLFVHDIKAGEFDHLH